MVNRPRYNDNDFYFSIIPGEEATATVPVGFGNCMWPWLNPGDHLRVEPVDSSEEIKKGWVAVFEYEGKILSHRVIAVDGDHFWARGDISRTTQGPIHRKKLLGKVVAYHRNESWDSLEGEFYRLGGLAYNTAMYYLLDSVDQWPIVKRLWKQAWIGEKLSKQIGAIVTTALLGTVVVTQESRSDVIYGILQSDKRLVGDTSTDALLRKNRVELFIARGRGGVQLGCAIIYNVSPKQKTGLVRLAPINSLIMPIGVEKELYRAIDRTAQRNGLKRLLTAVAKDDGYAQEMASMVGYHQTAFNTLGARIKKVLATANREEIFYEKVLPRRAY
jgi:hypothetical protein